jgi:hypothetical protein
MSFIMPSIVIDKECSYVAAYNKYQKLNQKLTKNKNRIPTIFEDFLDFNITHNKGLIIKYCKDNYIINKSRTMYDNDQETGNLWDNYIDYMTGSKLEYKVRAPEPEQDPVPVPSASIQPVPLPPVPPLPVPVDIPQVPKAAKPATKATKPGAPTKAPAPSMPAQPKTREDTTTRLLRASTNRLAGIQETIKIASQDNQMKLAELNKQLEKSSDKKGKQALQKRIVDLNKYIKGVDKETERYTNMIEASQKLINPPAVDT